MRDVLVALCGLTPQVVTETLWALGRLVPPIHPAEIQILTTERGRELCLAHLLGPGGALARYARDYRLGAKSPRCTPDRITVLRGAGGALLDDVRTEKDNQAIADQIADAVRRQTERPGTRLHCSVAGGRKTMGILLASALQLYGRPDDRLYHVLVSPPEFEGNQEFFYPPQPPCVLSTTDGKRLDTRRVRIELAEVPYVRLRSLLPEQVSTGPPRMTDLVVQAERELRALTSPDRVVIEPARNRLQIGEVTVRLTPAGLRLYTALARIKTRHCVEPQRDICGDCTACYPMLSPQTWTEERAKLQGLAGGPLLAGDKTDVGTFRSLVSKVNRALKEALQSQRVAKRYFIRAVGGRYTKAYGLAADKHGLQVPG